MVGGELRPAYREGEVIVKYRKGADRSLRSMDALYQRLSIVDVKRFGGKFSAMEALTLDTNNVTVEQAVADLKRDPAVEFAQPNYMIYALPTTKDDGGNKEALKKCWIPGIPLPPGCSDEPDSPGPAIGGAPQEVNPAVADPDLAKAYGISKIGADQAWKIQRGSKNVIVAVIDTGIDYNHPDLAFNIWRNPKANDANNGVDPNGDAITGDVVGYDFINKDALPFDDNMHGTHCAGTIGAVGGDGVGISGVNQRVSIMAVKFLSGAGSGDTLGAISAIDYAVSRGAKVLSNSWGGGADENNDALREAIVRAEKAGALFVAAAGNDGGNNDKSPTYPAAFDVENMVTVAATDSNDRMASFSNYGAKSVHVGAPGVDIYSTKPNNSYQKLSGTSMACPHVAGAAALIWAQYPNADYKEIKRRLLVSGDSIPALDGKTTTGKRINVLRALDPNI
jgi:subtilisin family serine protease